VSEKTHAEESPPESPQVVITDEEIFEAHVAGKLSRVAPAVAQAVAAAADTSGD
jgi:hypothetical protein